MKPKKFSVCIASHNMVHLVKEAIDSALMQDYPDFEIVVLDDASNDNTKGFIDEKYDYTDRVKYFRSETPSGTGGAFNKAIALSKGEYIILLCADDFLTDHRLLSDIAEVFDKYEHVGHVTRFYYQFMHEDKYQKPVRAWQNKSVIELANNPSGLAFRRQAIKGCELSNKMFVEAASLVCGVMDKEWAATTLPWDTVAVRIHQSISRNKEYYRKRWVSSPIEEWVKVGGEDLLNDWTSLIQIKNFFEYKGLLAEISNFMRLKPVLRINPLWHLFVLALILTPRAITMKAPDIYRRLFGHKLTATIIRPS